MPVPPHNDKQTEMQTERPKGWPDLSHIVLHFPDGRRSSCTLVAFEPSDESVGIFGTYIEVEDDQGTSYVLNDNGSNWVHPTADDEPDYSVITGTFSGELFPEPPAYPPITPRLILAAATVCQSTEALDEELDIRFGIGLDTELEVS